MKPIDVDATNPDLEALDTFLTSDRSPERSMMLSDLDGFLTGIAVGPEPILPSEWMPMVWGGESPEFEDEAEARTITGAILGRYNQILRGLAEEPPNCDAIFWENRDGEPVAGDWAEGFLDAMRLRFDAWQPLIDDRQSSDALLPILGLCSDEDGNSLLGLDAETDDELATDAPEMIPGCVVLIDAYWKSRRDGARQ